jgi:hypothetical protein
MSNIEIKSCRRAYRLFRKATVALTFISDKSFDRSAIAQVGDYRYGETEEQYAHRFVEAAYNILIYQADEAFDNAAVDPEDDVQFEREESAERHEARELALDYAGVDSRDLAEFWGDYD